MWHELHHGEDADRAIMLDHLRQATGPVAALTLGRLASPHVTARRARELLRPLVEAGDVVETKSGNGYRYDAGRTEG